MALEPTCSASKGSSICFIPAKQADVIAEFVNAGGDAREAGDDLGIHLSRIGLSGDVERMLEAEALGDQLVELLHLGMVAVKKRQESDACVPVVPFTPRNLSVCDAVFDLLQIDRQVLRPERGALADGRELGGLKMRVTERRQGLPLYGKIRQRVDRAGKPGGHAAEWLRA